MTERDSQRSASSSRQGGPTATAAAAAASGADRQIAHLSALLAESEAQNSRLEKLSEVCTSLPVLLYSTVSGYTTGIQYV
jgi:CelD/BcsL family acetyltransferase involved in cellulose biosynthesis